MPLTSRPVRAGRSEVYRKIAAAALLVVFCGRVVLTARQKSATFDEAYNISLGVSVIREGSFRFRQNKPVLSMCLQALPLLVAGAKPPAGPFSRSASLEFLYHNVVGAEGMLFWPRMMSMACAALLGLLVYSAAGVWALAFYTFSPNILAHAGLATEDMVLTLFYFASVYFFLGLTRRPTSLQAAVFGLATACAPMSKYTGLLLAPTLGWLWLTTRQRFPPRTWLAAAGGGALAFVLVYGPAHLVEFWRGLDWNNHAMSSGHATFFWGRYGTRGFLLYFAGAVLLKTTPPLLILSAIPLSRIDNYRKGEWPFWVAPVVVLFVIASFSPSQNGLRYILPIYPFLCVLAARQWETLPRAPGLFLAAWHALASVQAHPDYLAYFNGLAGGPAGGWRYLVESNDDWGQDLKGLQGYVKDNGVSDVVLSYYGCVLPEAIGFPFQDFNSLEIWGKKDHLNSVAPRKEILAVSVTNLQGMYWVPAFGYNPMDWVKEMAPAARIGNTIFVYDVTRDARAHGWLAHSYWVAGFPARARHEAARALAIEPEDPWAQLLTSFLARTPDEGLGLFARADAAHFADRLPWPRILASARHKAWYGRALRAVERELTRRGRAGSARSVGDLVRRLDLAETAAEKAPPAADLLERGAGGKVE